MHQIPVHVPQDATGGKSHANLIEVPTVAGSAASQDSKAAAAAPLDLSPPPSPEPLENGSPSDEDDAGEGEEEEGGGDGTIPNGGNESAHLLTNLLCTVRCTRRA